jgi:anthranilate synthase/aminodeoxychorismate synthase-like glutamine amidotransferase
MELLHHIKTIPILGVCLGHQAIAQAYGADLIRANEPVHGKTSQIYHASNDVFAGIPSPIRVARYHSLIVPAESLPYDLEVTAHADDGTVMGLRHRKAPIFGLQFHPESIATEYGETMLSNFVRLAREFGHKKRTAAPGN